MVISNNHKYGAGSLVDWTKPDNKIFLTQNGENITYGDMLELLLRSKDEMEPRQLLFFLGQNDLISMRMYLSCIEYDVVIVLLDIKIQDEQIIKLVDLYEPKYIFSKKIPPTLTGLYRIEQRYTSYNLYSNGSVKRPILNPALSLLLPTSGSTGSQKLVGLTKSNLISNCQSIKRYLNITSNDRAITSLPFNYSYGMSVVNSHLCAGATISLTDRSVIDRNFWLQMKEHEVTSFAGVPFTYETLLKIRFERFELPKLKTLTQAGGKLHDDALKKLVEIGKQKKIKIFVMYGQTEASPRISYLEPAFLETKLGSIGRAVPGGKLWIEDENEQEIHESDTVGELIYSGPNVSLGYALTLDDLNFDGPPPSTLRTGDLARRDRDGFYFIVGRKSRFIKITGRRYSLDEIEAEISKLGLVCAAFGVDNRLIIAIQAEKPKSTPNINSIHKQLLNIHITKGHYKYMELELLPRLNSGKVDYIKLQSTYR